MTAGNAFGFVTDFLGVSCAEICKSLRFFVMIRHRKNQTQDSTSQERALSFFGVLNKVFVIYKKSNVRNQFLY